ncbi:hypothetical protein EST38_g4969 [Candolleomyces aberdarensis]|uniref:Uncharacterized protein n=1 Tax=Candolleomyces aberdarensis TaxID=2316362 RepID=A0A4V1Q453_9AGAR|nr:hypothetical protein EST38_g4969 [Candolleomyces aberdarensis]
MRPIIYDDAPAPSPPTLLRHPYSLTEFQDAQSRPVDLEIQFKLQRQQLDNFHQDFWLDNNIRYYAAKETALSNLPETATDLDKENALSEFNTLWYIQEKERTDQYTDEWRKRNFQLIRLGAQVEFQKLAFRLSKFFQSS